MNALYSSKCGLLGCTSNVQGYRCYGETAEVQAARLHQHEHLESHAQLKLKHFTAPEASLLLCKSGKTTALAIQLLQSVAV